MIWGNTNRTYPVITVTFYSCYRISEANTCRYRVQLPFSTLILDFKFIGSLSPWLNCQIDFCFEGILQTVQFLSVWSWGKCFFWDKYCFHIWKEYAGKVPAPGTVKMIKKMRHGASSVRVVSVCRSKSFTFQEAKATLKRWKCIAVEEHMCVFV